MSWLFQDNFRCASGCTYSTYIPPDTFFSEPPKCPWCNGPLMPIDPKDQRLGFDEHAQRRGSDDRG